MKPLRFMAVALLLLTGCVVNDSMIVSDKSTVFGLEVAYQGELPHVRLGLIRHYYFRLPTSTNGPVFAPYFVSDTTADIGLTRQTANERFAAGSTNFQWLAATNK